MFSLDDSFLEDVGLGALPDDQKRPFLQHVYDQLEARVGASLSEGMTDAQLDEFEAIIDRRDEVVTAWLGRYVPEYLTREDYQKLQQALIASTEEPELKAEYAAPGGSPVLRAEYAATKWLEVNRPDYRDVVAKTLEALKQEIIANKDVILGTPAA